jgi:ribA/ribD-fused uncharacterized protein
MAKTWIAFPPLPEDKRVLFFLRDREAFQFLSNFYPSKMRVGNETWPTVEHYYQAQKSDNPDYVKYILKKGFPGWAKHAGDSRIENKAISKKSWFRKNPQDLLPDWDDKKLQVMREGVCAKFSQNKHLQNALLKTRGATLIEDSGKDFFWGWGSDRRGLNHLGKILMEVRAN